MVFVYMKDRSTISEHFRTQHPGKDCQFYYWWTCELKFKHETTLKWHNNAVKYLLEKKRMKTTTDTLEQSPQVASTVCSTLPEIVRYHTYTDKLDQESHTPRHYMQDWWFPTKEFTGKPVVIPSHKYYLLTNKIQNLEKVLQRET